MNCRHLVLTSICALALLASGAHAADEKRAARDREALQRSQSALRAAQEEKAALSAKLAELELRAKSAEDKAGTAQRGNSAAKKRIAELEAEQQTLRGEAERLTVQLESLKRDHAQLGEREKAGAGALTQRVREITELQGVSAKQVKDLGVCAERNARLYVLGRELIDRYEKKSCYDSLLQSEPVTQLKRVEIENLVEDYRDKLDEQKSLPVRR